jgi:hypothetical protein
LLAERFNHRFKISFGAWERIPKIVTLNGNRCEIFREPSQARYPVAHVDSLRFPHFSLSVLKTPASPRGLRHDSFSPNRLRLSQPQVLSITKRTPAAFLLGMQTLCPSSNGENGQLPYSNTSLRLRAFRFLSERFAQRERPSVAAEFILFALIVATSTWSILSLAHAMRINL